jgi:hypothetical protein
MSLRASTLGLVLCATIIVGAAEQGAPLENSQRELKTLQRDQATQSSGVATGKLGEGLPQIQTPIPGALPPDLPKSAKGEPELKKKKDAQKNWLLDGVDKLEKSTNPRGHRAGETKEAALPEGQSEQLDSTDPDYLLNLYSEQQKAAEAKADTKYPRSAQSDPFAPFLQGWLSSSPQRGRFLGEFAGKPDANVVATAPGGSPGTVASQNFNGGEVPGTPRGAGGAPPVNPYLQGLDLPSLQDFSGSRNQAPVAPDAWSKPPDGRTAVLPADPIPSVRQTDKKPMQPPLADDKKYFPQLKKF